MLEKIMSRIEKTPTCWLWIGAHDRRGYGTFHHRDRTYKAHRVVYTLLVGEIPPGKLLLHSCDNPACVNPEHLTPGTHQDNINDMMKKGRHRKPQEKRPIKKLSLEEKQAIVLNKDRSNRSLAKEFGVSVTTIRRVRGSRPLQLSSIVLTPPKGLTPEQKLIIARSTSPTKELATEFGVSNRIIRSIRGLQPPQPLKLSPEQIKEAILSRAPARVLAERFGCSIGLIYKYRKDQT